MNSIALKKIFFCLAIILFISAGCDLNVVVAPSTPPVSLPTDTIVPATVAPTQIPASPIPATPTVGATPTATQPSFIGEEFTVHPISIVLVPEIAGGVHGTQMPRAEGQDLPYWELTPAHTILTLEAYRLLDKMHQPQIYVYPATDYALMVPAAFESIHRLDNILYTPGGMTLTENLLPAVPFFNAAQVFASNIQMISFQNGGGVRFLTEYAQYPASVNNHDLFYHFQGLTRDGAYYVIAILPITAPMLAETSDAGAPLPEGGVPYPFMADPNADMQRYYLSVTELLNATPSEGFFPTLDQLDLLIQSMQINQ